MWGAHYLRTVEHTISGLFLEAEGFECILGFLKKFSFPKLPAGLTENAEYFFLGDGTLTAHLSF